MTTLLIAQRLHVLLGIGLVGLGLFVLAHASLTRGGSLVLLGLGVLERRLASVRRLFVEISHQLDAEGDGAIRARPRRPTPPASAARRRRSFPCEPLR